MSRGMRSSEMKRKTNRLLCKSSKGCPYGCTYCFAKFSPYTSLTSQDKFDRIPEKGGVIVYPSCDSEILADKSLLPRVREEIERTTGTVWISVSTKSRLNARALKEIRAINQILCDQKRGFFKVSVSLSTKYSIPSVESGTSPYSTRIEVLQELKDHAIPSSVNIKPILPFVHISEYLEIVDDCLRVSDIFLLGGLYIDPYDEFGGRMLREYPHLVTHRKVDWLEDHPLWPHLMDDEKSRNIAEHIYSAGGHSFLSDSDVIHFIDAKPALSHSPLEELSELKAS